MNTWSPALSLRAPLCVASSKEKSGVYIIYENLNKKAIYIGQSTNIGRRLGQHKYNSDIEKHDNGLLIVTWTEVEDLDDRTGIESFLHCKLKPMIESEVSLDSTRKIPIELPPDLR